MNIKDFAKTIWANKGHLWSIGNRAGTEIAEVLDDGKVTPVEAVDAAHAVVVDALDEYKVSDHVLVEVPVGAYDQAALIHQAVEIIRIEAVAKLTDRKLTAKEAADLAHFASRAILKAIPQESDHG